MGASLIFTIGRRYRRQASDTIRTANHIPLMHFTDMDDLVEHLPHSCMLVGIEIDPSARNLAEYVHPERAAYLLGAEDYGLPPDVIERCHSLIQVESPRYMCLNVAVAGSLVMWDRHVKRQRTFVVPDV
jgi:tRNA G18 (ribose-2'-O)-methylase SpoU